MKYHLSGIEKASVSADRNGFDIEFRTDQGPVTLTLNAGDLDALITLLEGIESRASLLDPAKGAMPGEPMQVRRLIVDQHQVGNGVVNGTPSVLLGLTGLKGATTAFRWFALDAPKAEALQRAIADEIPKLPSRENRQ